MTMINPDASSAPQQNLSTIKNPCYGSYGGCSFSDGGYGGIMSRLEEGYGSRSEAEAPPANPDCLLSRSSSDLGLPSQQLIMAQQDAPPDQLEHKHKGDDDDPDPDQGWLQLSIGGVTADAKFADKYDEYSNNTEQQQEQEGEDDQRNDQVSLPDHPRGGGRGISTELDLLLPAPAGSTTSSSSFSPIHTVFHIEGPAEFRAPPRPPKLSTNYINSSSSLFLQHLGGAVGGGGIISSFAGFPPHQEITNLASSVVPPAGPYFTGPFQLQAGLGVATARPSTIFDFRVIDPPPRRQHSGIWFMLQAAQNQAKEPFLPQISKSFLRIKDGGMTIRLVIKYLVDKLKLESESEVEIRCRGQQVLPFLTMQHVRDSMWRPSDVVPILPDISTTDHLMLLHYGRSA